MNDEDGLYERIITAVHRRRIFQSVNFSWRRLNEQQLFSFIPYSWTSLTLGTSVSSLSLLIICWFHRLKRCPTVGSRLPVSHMRICNLKFVIRILWPVSPQWISLFIRALSKGCIKSMIDFPRFTLGATHGKAAYKRRVSTAAISRERSYVRAYSN